mmetsp:Transcript_49937/g.159813  ORF Transcript_49937/g.159813 Transcript_49937/m.159813 type:complete len:225 (+) Transcript_49937:161-835(+)
MFSRSAHPQAPLPARVDAGRGAIRVLLTMLLCAPVQALNSFLTAFASVYTEKIMKGNGDSIHFQNMILYVWGVVFTTLSLFVNSSYRGTPLTVDMLFENHNVFSVTLIFNYAFTGLATAFVIKFLDNMLKTFAATCAMFLVSLVSSAIYKEPVTMQLLVGMSIVGLAVEVYTREQARIERGKQPPSAAASPAGQPLLEEGPARRAKPEVGGGDGLLAGWRGVWG